MTASTGKCANKNSPDPSRAADPASYPVHAEPAYLLERPEGARGNVMVLADIHFGFEHNLADAGAHLPSQTENITKHILDISTKNDVSDLVLLGDIKHKVPGTSRQEWRELPEVFSELSRAFESVSVIPGNHDGGLNRMIPGNLRNIHFHPNTGTVLYDHGLFHGHTWPKPEVLKSRIILMGHNHPHAVFVDALGGRASYPCWVRARLAHEQILKRYKNFKAKGQELIIMPAFNEPGGGTPVTSPEPEFLGPILKNKCIDLDNAKIYLLDGTDLGRLGELTELSSEQAPGRKLDRRKKVKKPKKSER